MSKVHFTLASLLASILKFYTRLQLHSNSNKLTKNALLLHSESDKKRYTPTPGFAHLR